jgi:lactonase family protein with 7-bladed beta-propeller
MRRAILGLMLTLMASLPLAFGPSGAAEASSSSSFIYVNDGGTQVFGFLLDDNDNLSELPNSPFSTGVGTASSCTGNCQSIIFSDSRDLLFVGTADGLVVFSVDGDGDLTIDPNSPYLSGTEIVGLAELEVRKNGIIVYAAAPDDDEVHIFKVNKDDSLSELKSSPRSTGDQPFGLSVADTMLYVANAGDDTISVFKIGGNGDLSKGGGSPFDPGHGDDLINVFSHQTGQKGAAVYTPAFDGTDIFGFKARKQRNPVLRKLDGSPFQTDLDDSSGGLALGGNLVYAIDGGGTDVQAFKRNKDNLLETRGDPQDSGLNELALGAMAHGQDFLILVGEDRSSGDDTITVYSTDSDASISQHQSLTLSEDFAHGANGIVLTRP